jgi:hypothetical protein
MRERDRVAKAQFLAVKAARQEPIEALRATSRTCQSMAQFAAE